jgi:hypothetical protein
MSLIAKETTSTFKPVPPGMHLARCYRVVDLGTQKTEYMGVAKERWMIMINWEVHGEDDAGSPLLTSKGEPMSVSKNYANTLAPKSTLRRDLSSWRGRDFTSDELKGFELKNLLGVWCMVTIKTSMGSDGKEYLNIDSVNPVPAAIKAAGLPVPFSKPELFDLEKPDMSLFSTFHERLKTKIMSSPEWSKLQNPTSSTVDEDDQIPF